MKSRSIAAATAVRRTSNAERRTAVVDRWL
jgi:hypothetical protein